VLVIVDALGASQALLWRGRAIQAKKRRETEVRWACPPVLGRSSMLAFFPRLRGQGTYSQIGRFPDAAGRERAARVHHPVDERRDH
jgi:hypothetical protein